LHDRGNAAETLGIAAMGTAPVDFLSHRLQHLDHHGGSLLELTDRSDRCLLYETQRKYWQLLNPWHPDGSSQFESVCWHLEALHRDMEAVVNNSRGCCVSLGAAVWARLEGRYFLEQ
jgi:hypothetical protein